MINFSNGFDSVIWILPSVCFLGLSCLIMFTIYCFYINFVFLFVFIEKNGVYYFIKLWTPMKMPHYTPKAKAKAKAVVRSRANGLNGWYEVLNSHWRMKLISLLAYRFPGLAPQISKIKSSPNFRQLQYSLQPIFISLWSSLSWIIQENTVVKSSHSSKRSEIFCYFASFSYLRNAKTFSLMAKSETS